MRIDVRDYRALPPDAQFDKIVSVGMVEHVGRAQLPAYFVTAHRCLRPGGPFLNHGIVLGTAGPASGPLRWLWRRLWREGAFVQRYVFPDGELAMPHEMLRCAEQAAFETRDVENLREHYARTLRHWVRRLEARHAAAAALVGEPTYRVWRLYMAGSAHAFATGGLGVVQALFSKPAPQGASGLPLTRADLYQEAPATGRAAPGRAGHGLPAVASLPVTPEQTGATAGEASSLSGQASAHRDGGPDGAGPEERRAVAGAMLIPSDRGDTSRPPAGSQRLPPSSGVTALAGHRVGGQTRLRPRSTPATGQPTPDRDTAGRAHGDISRRDVERATRALD